MRIFKDFKFRLIREATIDEEDRLCVFTANTLESEDNVVRVTWVRHNKPNRVCYHTTTVEGYIQDGSWIEVKEGDVW